MSMVKTDSQKRMYEKRMGEFGITYSFLPYLGFFTLKDYLLRKKRKSL
jgi:hypothetical protein